MNITQDEINKADKAMRFLKKFCISGNCDSCQFRKRNYIRLQRNFEQVDECIFKYGYPPAMWQIEDMPPANVYVENERT